MKPASAVPAPPAAQAPARGRWAVMTLLFFGILVSYMDRGNLSIAAVPLMKDFGMSATSMGTLLSAFFWTYAIFQMPAGYLVDRFGIRLTYAAAFALWSLASAATGLATSPFQILAARLALGLGEAVAPLASMAYIKQNFNDQERGFPTALYISGMTLGPALGAFAGTALLEWYGWRVMFIVTGLAALVWLLPWFLFAPRGVTRIQRETPAGPIHFGRLLRSSIFWALTISIFVYSYFWYFVLTWVPSYLVLTHGFSNLQMGATVGIPLVAMSAVSLGSGSLSDWAVKKAGAALTVRKIFVCCGFLVASSVLLLLVIPLKALVMPIFILSLCGLGIAGGNYWALSQMASPPELIGRAIGYQNTIAQVAGVVAPILTGFLLGPSKDFTTAILVAGLCPLIAAAAVYSLIRQTGIQRLQESLGHQEQ